MSRAAATANDRAVGEGAVYEKPFMRSRLSGAVYEPGEPFMKAEEPSMGLEERYGGESGTSVVVSRAAATANDRAADCEPFMRSHLREAVYKEPVMSQRSRLWERRDR